MPHIQYVRITDSEQGFLLFISRRDTSPLKKSPLDVLVFLRLQSHRNRAVNGLNRDVDLSVCQIFHSHDVVVLSLFV